MQPLNINACPTRYSSNFLDDLEWLTQKGVALTKKNGLILSNMNGYGLLFYGFIPFFLLERME